MATVLGGARIDEHATRVGQANWCWPR